MAAVVALLSAVTVAPAQVFEAGYSFTQYFSGLPGHQTMVIIPETGFYLRPYHKPATATIAWEIFDSLPGGVPIHSGIWQPGDMPYAPLFDETWLDGEGSFRFTILSGAQMIEHTSIYVARWDAGTEMFTVYAAQFPPAAVPEPGVAACFAVGVACFAFWRRRPRFI